MNTLFLISGMSGVGKTSVMRCIMNNEIVSFTTRPKRNEEIDNVDYKFITIDEFNNLKDNNGLYEESEYPGLNGSNYYGVTLEEFESKLSKGPAFNIVNFDGMIQFSSKYENCVSIFIYADKDEAIRRMQIRGESDAFIEKRLVTFEKELFNSQFYDYKIKNPDNCLNGTINIVKEIIRSHS